MRKYNDAAKKEIEQPLYNLGLRGWHYRSLVKRLVEMANLRGNEKILDFGCGTQELKNFLPEDCKAKYLGYDKIKEISDVSDYKSLKDVEVVFCDAVLEHLNNDELEELLQDFKGMKVKKVAIWIPNDNVLQRFLEVAFNQDISNRFEHFQGAREITNALVNAYGIPVKMERFHLIAYLAIFDLRGK